MKGCRPLNDSEIDSLLHVIYDLYSIPVAHRTVTALTVMCCTGIRVAECCSLQLHHVAPGGKAHEYGYLPAANTKGKHRGRQLYLGNPWLQEQLTFWLHYSRLTEQSDNCYLFPRYLRGGDNHDLNIWQYSIPFQAKSMCMYITKAADIANLGGKIGTHSFRKTFAKQILESTSSIVDTMEALGHQKITTTMAYVGANQARIQQAMATMYTRA